MEDKDLLNSTELPEDIQAFKDKAKSILSELKAVMQDPLGKPKEFYETEISTFKKLYYLLSLKYHPDRNSEDQKTYYQEQFTTVSNAYAGLIEEGSGLLEGKEIYTIYDVEYLKKENDKLKEKIAAVKALNSLQNRHLKIVEKSIPYRNQPGGLPKEFNLGKIRRLSTEETLVNNSSENDKQKKAKYEELEKILLFYESSIDAYIKKEADKENQIEKLKPFFLGGLAGVAAIGIGVGAGIGFVIGGPIGAGVGAAIGFSVGASIGIGSPLIYLSSEEKVPPIIPPPELQSSKIFCKIEREEKIQETKDNIELFKVGVPFLVVVLGAAIGAGIGFVIGGPIGAGIGVAVGLCVGAVIGLPVGHLGWKLIFAKDLASMKEDVPSQELEAPKLLNNSVNNNPSYAYGNELLKMIVLPRDEQGDVNRKRNNLGIII